MSKEETCFDFEWHCPRCKRNGISFGDDEFWKFCPYCGSSIEVKEIDYAAMAASVEKAEHEVQTPE